MGKTFTGNVHTDATNSTHCPKCGAEPHSTCRQPNDKVRTEPHKERVASYRRYIGEAEYHARHVKTFQEAQRALGLLR